MSLSQQVVYGWHQFWLAGCSLWSVAKLLVVFTNFCYHPCDLWFCADALLLVLLLSHFSRVRLCATPETAAHQTSPSLGFSRQEHWSGLPFPSPMHESEKWKWKWSRVRLCMTPWTAAYQAPRPWDFPGKSTGVGWHCVYIYIFTSRYFHQND